MPDKTLTTMIVTALGTLYAPIFFGAFGGGSRYLHKVVHKKVSFNFWDFLMYTVLGTFVGLLVHYLMYEAFNTSFSGVILLSGLLSQEVITLIEKSGVPEPVKRLLGVKD